MSRRQAVSPKCISRLSLYGRLLSTGVGSTSGRVYSHELARLAGVSAAQVRRDIMGLGCSGTPNTGYDVQALGSIITEYIHTPEGQRVALVGVGNLGKAILTYFSHGSKTRLRLVAAFDTARDKTGRVLHGCRCHPMEEMSDVIRRENITVGIITVPADVAQQTADALINAGVTGILNCAPVALQVPARVYVENLDITIKLETVAFFARSGRPQADG